MKVAIKYFVLIVIVSFAACSNEKEPAQEGQLQEGELSEDNVFKGYVDALDKAKGVEQAIHDAAQKRREEEY